MSGQRESLKIVADTIKSLQLYCVYISVASLAFVSGTLGAKGITGNFLIYMSFLFFGFIVSVFSLFFIAEEVGEAVPNLYDRRIMFAVSLLFLLIIMSVVLMGRFVYCDYLAGHGWVCASI